MRAHADGFRAAIESFRAALAEDAEPALRIETEQGLSWRTHSVETAGAALVHARRALGLTEELDDKTLLAHALSHVAFLDSLGGSGMAMEAIERALTLGSEPGWTQILGRPDWIHSLPLLWDGRLTEARDRLAALHAEALERGDAHSLPFVLFQLARVQLLLGDREAAERLAGECADSVDASARPLRCPARTRRSPSGVRGPRSFSARVIAGGAGGARRDRRSTRRWPPSRRSARRYRRRRRAPSSRASVGALPPTARSHRPSGRSPS